MSSKAPSKIGFNDLDDSGQMLITCSIVIVSGIVFIVGCVLGGALWLILF